MKQKRNVSAEAAERAGASWGSVTSRARRSGPAPSTAAASALRGIDRRPGAADDARDDGDVEEDVRGEDRPEAPLVAVGEQRQERGRDDDGRQHEGDEHERPRERAAAEPEAPDRPGERQPGDEREQRRRGCLPGREPEQPGRARGERRARRRR